MKAGCAAQKLQFEAYGKRDVVADFDGGRMTSDGGGLLLREANCCLGDLMARLGQCVSDFRQQGSVEHTATDLIAQRVCALALGYEDLNDHGTLRRDGLLALLAGRKDLTGQGRKRKRDRAAPLTSAATLKRFELGRPETAAQHRYHRVLVDRTCSWSRRRKRRRRSGWTWTRSTTRRTASRKAVSIMATTGSTAICRCTFSASTTRCARGCGRWTGTPPTAAWRSWSASWDGSGSAGRRPGSASARTRGSAATGS